MIADGCIAEPESVAKPKVCMLVYNNFTNDSRVQKQAETLLSAGYRVTVMARLDQLTEPREKRNGIHVERVATNSLNLRPVQSLQFFVRPNDNKKTKHARIWEIFAYLFKTLAYGAIALGAVALLSHSDFYDYFNSEKLTIYLILGLAIAFRKIILQIPKKIRRASTLLIKKSLSPFSRYFFFLSFYRQVYKSSNGSGYKVYHAHDLNTLPAAWICARRDHAKLVYDSHELYVERNRRNPASAMWKCILKRIEAFLIRGCDAAYTVNKSLAAEMARRYNVAEPDVIMNAPACFSKLEHAENNTQLREELSIAPSYKILLYVGSITFNRGLESLIKSLAYLPDCYLVFMGYGVDTFKQSLQALAEEQGVTDRFAFYGPVPTDQVIHYAAGADIGVAPIANACLSYYYCSPNKLFEYMNAGLPVIASNFPELEKTVLGHEIGYTFDPNNPEDIAKAARAILDNPEKARLMHDNALQAATLYNWGNESKKLLEIYQKLQCASPS